jgi:Dockerin type I domain
MRTRVLLPVVFFPFLSAALPGSRLLADVMLTFSPQKQTVNLGNTAKVDIVVSNLGLPPYLGDFDITVNFDGAILGDPSVDFGMDLGNPDPGAGETVTGSSPAPGSFEFFEVSLLDKFDLKAIPQVPSFTLATLSFPTLQVGVSPLSMANITLGDENGDPIAFTTGTGEITVIATPEPASGWLLAGLLLLLALARLRIRWGGGKVLGLLAIACASLPAQNTQKVCVNLYRYGGAASTWTRQKTNSQLLLASNIFLNNGPAVEWRWDPDIIEDLVDPYGERNGDIENAPAGDNAPAAFDSVTGNLITTSRDIQYIYRATADSQCYPVVFVNGGLGSAGLTYGVPFGSFAPRMENPNIPCAFGGKQCSAGILTLIDTSSFPRLEDPTTQRQESKISTLAHELGHAVCLDPDVGTGIVVSGKVTNGSNAIDVTSGQIVEGGMLVTSIAPSPAGQANVQAVTVPNGTKTTGSTIFLGFLGSEPRNQAYLSNPVTITGGAATATVSVALTWLVTWGDSTGHPPRPTPPVGVTPPGNKDPANPDTPEGAGFVVQPPFKDAGSALRSDVMWFTGAERSGDEKFTDRQSSLASYCAGFLRGRFSPSFSVAPNGPTQLSEKLLYYAPASVPPDPAFSPGVILTGGDIAGISYDRKQLLPGRYPFRFTVDSASMGTVGSAVAARADRTASEFAGPVPVAGNVDVMGSSHFNLQAIDQIDALEPLPPSVVDPSRTGAVTPLPNTNSRLYFTLAAGGVGTDPATIYRADAITNAQGVTARGAVPYAVPNQLGLQLGDELGSMCVADSNGNGLFDAIDTVYFTLKRNSPTLVAAGLSAADVLTPITPPPPPGGAQGGFAVVQGHATLGLLQGDQIMALKCHTPPRKCDVNFDGKIDVLDITAITDQRNKPAAGPGDPLDVNSDGKIDVNDARICTLLCDKVRCAQ